MGATKKITEAIFEEEKNISKGQTEFLMKRNRIRTRVMGAGGKNADHYTTTTALRQQLLKINGPVGLTATVKT